MAEKTAVLQEISGLLSRASALLEQENGGASEEFLNVVNSLHQKTLLYQILPEDIKSDNEVDVASEEQPEKQNDTSPQNQIGTEKSVEIIENEKLFEEADVAATYGQDLTDNATYQDEEITPEEAKEQEETIELNDDHDSPNGKSIENDLASLNTSTPETESQYGNEHNSSNDNPAVSLADKFLSKDLMKSIGISEKFLFVNELFDGNTEEYTKQINRLNESKDLSEAQNILQKLAAKNNWEAEDKASLTLNNLVERKFNA